MNYEKYGTLSMYIFSLLCPLDHMKETINISHNLKPKINLFASDPFTGYFLFHFLTQRERLLSIAFVSTKLSQTFSIAPLIL